MVRYVKTLSKNKMAVYLLLCVWSVLASEISAFKPTVGQGDDPAMYTHESITLEGIDRAAAYFLTSNGILNTTKTVHNEIVKEFFGSDTNSYGEYKQRGREFAMAVINAYRTFHTDPDYTVNSERIHEADKLVKTTRMEIASVLSSGALSDASLKLLVNKVGKCLMIIQSFYSNTNWIEMMVDGGESFLTFGTLAPDNMRVAESGTVTCRNCDDSKAYGCSQNLLVSQRLTSGYLAGQQFYPKPKANPLDSEGKCSHGGVNDPGRNSPATGGINKDTPDWNWSPHANLHNTSGQTAVRATEAFFMDARSGVLNGIDQDTVKGLFKLKTKLRVNASMGFVIDITGSMADDITKVKIALTSKVSAVIGTVNEPSKYVLSTFNDPASLTTVNTTTDGYEMIQWIENLRVYGGGDCPEYAMSGVLAAINACTQNSIIYGATDADAKDEDITADVTRAAKAKNITVTFIKTGNCTSIRRRRDIQVRQKRGVSAFESLAAGTGGSVYNIDHSEVTAVLDHVLDKDFPSSEAIIDYFVQETSDNNTMAITVDSEAAVLVITIMGPYSLSQASLSNPNGTVQVFPTKLATQYYSSHKITMSIQKPSPGIWKLKRHTSGLWKVNVTASTYLDIDSQLKETDGFGISYPVDRNPIMGKNYTLEVLAYNLNSSSTSFCLHLIDEQGADLYNRPVHITFWSSKITGYISVVLPTKNFYVQLSGIDQNGFKFKRMSRKLIKPVGVDLSVPHIFDNLDTGIAQNITYTVSNLGATTQTYTVSIADDKSRLQGPTSRQHTLLAGNSTTGLFHILSNVELESVSYTVSVKLPGSSNVLQSSSSSVMFKGPICSSLVTQKCRQAYTGSNCSMYTWSGTAVFSFDVSTYVNVANVSMTIDSSDRNRVHVSGTCCQDDFTVNAKPSAGSGCQTSQGVIASDQEADMVDVADIITDGSSQKKQNNATDPHRDPVSSSGPNIGLIVGVVIGTSAFIVGTTTGAIVIKAKIGGKGKSKINDSLEHNDYPQRHDGTNKLQFNKTALEY